MINPVFDLYSPIHLGSPLTYFKHFLHPIQLSLSTQLVSISILIPYFSSTHQHEARDGLGFDHPYGKGVLKKVIKVKPNIRIFWHNIHSGHWVPYRFGFGSDPLPSPFGQCPLPICRFFSSLPNTWCGRPYEPPAPRTCAGAAPWTAGCGQGPVKGGTAQCRRGGHPPGSGGRPGAGAGGGLLAAWWQEQHCKAGAAPSHLTDAPAPSSILSYL